MARFISLAFLLNIVFFTNIYGQTEQLVNPDLQGIIVRINTNEVPSLRAKSVKVIGGSPEVASRIRKDLAHWLHTPITTQNVEAMIGEIHAAYDDADVRVLVPDQSVSTNVIQFIVVQRPTLSDSTNLIVRNGRLCVSSDIETVTRSIPQGLSVRNKELTTQPVEVTKPKSSWRKEVNSAYLADYREQKTQEIVAQLSSETDISTVGKALDPDSAFRTDRGQEFVSTFNLNYTWSSNVFGKATAVSDSGFSALAEFTYRRERGVYQLITTADFRATKWNNTSSKIDIDPSFRATVTRSRGRLKGAVSASWAESTATDLYIGQRVKSSSYGISGDFKYPFFTRLYTAGNIGWQHSSTQTATSQGNAQLLAMLYPAFDTYSAGIDLGYSPNHLTSYFGGIGYQETPKFKTKDLMLSLGMNRTFSPKTSMSIRAGVEQRKEVQRNQSTMYVAGDLTWRPTHRLSITGTVNKNFSFSPTGANADTLKGALNARYTIKPKLTWSNDLSYADLKYQDINSRHDQRPAVTTGLYWEAHRRLTLSLSYTYLRNYSNVKAFSYKQETITVSAFTRF